LIISGEPSNPMLNVLMGFPSIIVAIADITLESNPPDNKHPTSRCVLYTLLVTLFIRESYIFGVTGLLTMLWVKYLTSTLLLLHIIE